MQKKCQIKVWILLIRLKMSRILINRIYICLILFIVGCSFKNKEQVEIVSNYLNYQKETVLEYELFNSSFKIIKDEMTYSESFIPINNSKEWMHIAYDGTFRDTIRYYSQDESFYCGSNGKKDGYGPLKVLMKSIRFPKLEVVEVLFTKKEKLQHIQLISFKNKIFNDLNYLEVWDEKIGRIAFLGISDNGDIKQGYCLKTINYGGKELKINSKNIVKSVKQLNENLKNEKVYEILKK